MRYFSFIKIHIVIIILAGSLSSCEHKGQYVTYTGNTQGTYYLVTYQSPKNVSYEADIKQLLDDFSAALSTYDPSSLISRINQNDPTAVVNDLFRTVFNKAVEVNKASNGVFDITIAPIVNFWGFGFTDEKPEINTQKIDSLLQYVGMNKIRIVGDRVVKDLPQILLDVNAIAKGYSVDVIADFLLSKGVKNFLVNIGGECVARGVNPDGIIWKLGVEKPIDGARYGETQQAIIFLNNRAMATSANSQRFVVIDGVKYAHTIDVKTGFPVAHNLLSATVIADDCMTADAWATVFMASGFEKTIEFLQMHPEFEALLIYSDENGDFRTYTTRGLDAVIF